MLDLLHHILEEVVGYSIWLFECAGVLIILVTCIQGIISYARKSQDTRLNLAKGLELGLEFKLGSEILRTVTVRDYGEILIVACIIALRALLTFLIHWEIKNEEGGREHREKQEEKETEGQE